MRLFASSADAPPTVAKTPSAAVKSVVRADTKSGRLVRATVALPQVVSPADRLLNKAQAGEIIDRIAAEQGVEAPLVHSVARAESDYDPLAVSPKGAEGIMQLEPSTARRFGVQNSFDPEENVRGGVKYLKYLLDYYQGDYTKAVAAYNAGEKAVDRYRGTPPYAETRNYVARVARNLATAREKNARKPTMAMPAAVPAETYRPIRTSVGSDGRIYYRTP